MFRIGPYLVWRIFGITSLVVAGYVASLYAKVVPLDMAHAQIAIVMMYVVNAYFAVAAFKADVEKKVAWMIGLLLFGALLSPVFWLYASKRQMRLDVTDAENGH